MSINIYFRKEGEQDVEFTYQTDSTTSRAIKAAPHEAYSLMRSAGYLQEQAFKGNKEISEMLSKNYKIVLY